MPYKTSLFIIIIKTFFLNSLLISLYYKSIKGVFYTRTNIFINKSYFISIFIKVKWFLIIGFLVIRLVTECF
jgi:Ulp1 family protease